MDNSLRKFVSGVLASRAEPMRKRSARYKVARPFIYNSCLMNYRRPVYLPNAIKYRNDKYRTLYDGGLHVVLQHDSGVVANRKRVNRVLAWLQTISRV